MHSKPCYRLFTLITSFKSFFAKIRRDYQYKNLSKIEKETKKRLLQGHYINNMIYGSRFELIL